MRHHLTGLAAGLAAGTLVLTGCGGDQDDDATTTTGTSSSSQTSGPEGGGTSATGSDGAQDLADATFPVSWRDALDTARGEFDGDVSKIELEPDDAGAYHYKVELLSDTQKYAVQLDAESGEVITDKTDDLDADEVGDKRADQSVDPDKVVSVARAMSTAKGVHDGPVTKWKLEGKAAGPRYEFDIDDTGGQEDHEVQVDAVEGTVITDED